jgi:hypothetical protein
MRRLVILLIAVLGTISLASASAQAAGAPRIISPRVDSFFAKRRVTVKVGAPRSASSLTATLDGKPVGGAFRRRRAGLWSATFGARLLSAGANRLVVSTRARGDRRRYVSTRFTVGRRDRTLLTVRGPRRPDRQVARVSIARRAQRLSADLNGKRLRWPHGVAPSRKELLRLGADDGLHFGVNHLKVRAVRGNGAYDVENRKVVVPRDRPLAGAGPDHKIVSGAEVRLDGTSSQPAGPGAALSYSWSVVEKPAGSQPVLSQATSPQPLLLTNEPGTYAVRLLVTETQMLEGEPVVRTASDVVLLPALDSVAPIGLPVETMVTRGEDDETGIKIGGQTFWQGEGNDYQAVIVDRKTLNVTYAAGFSNDENIKPLAEKVKNAGSESLVVLADSWTSESYANVGLVAIAKTLGADVGTLRDGQPGWSAVGVPGSTDGGYVAAGWNGYPGEGPLPGVLDGYLQQTEDELFSFNPGSRITFETSGPGSSPLRNKIRIGTAEYQSTPFTACGTGGFQLQAVAAETLRSVAGGTFVTDGCGSDADNQEIQRMASALNAVSAEERLTLQGPDLVFVQSIGVPFGGAGSVEPWRELASALGRLGGTPSVFATPADSASADGHAGYALVGGSGVEELPLVEAAEALTGSRNEAKITGLLKPNPVGSYVPALYSPSGASTSPTLSAIAYQPAQAWPDSQSEGDKAALEYIAEKVLGLEKPALGISCEVPSRPDVRSEYCNTQYRNAWTGFEGKLAAAKFKSGEGFGLPEWEAVVQELAGPNGEFKDVQGVWALVSTLQKIFGLEHVEGEVDLNSIASGIKKAITPPPNSDAAGYYIELLGNLSATASYFSFGKDAEDVQKLLGVFQGTFFEAAANVKDPLGDPLLAKFEVRTTDLATELAKRYVEASTAIGYIGEILVSDHGKLQAVSESGLLGTSEAASKGTIKVGKATSELWTYQSLLPAAFEPITLKAGGRNEPLPAKASEFICTWRTRSKGVTYRPFEEATEAGEYKADQPTDALGVFVIAGAKLPQSNGAEQIKPTLPTARLLKPLTANPGYFQPWFWREAYGFPSSKARSISC